MHSSLCPYFQVNLGIHIPISWTLCEPYSAVLTLWSLVREHLPPMKGHTGGKQCRPLSSEGGVRIKASGILCRGGLGGGLIQILHTDKTGVSMKASLHSEVCCMPTTMRARATLPSLPMPWLDGNRPPGRSRSAMYCLNSPTFLDFLSEWGTRVEREQPSLRRRTIACVNSRVPYWLLMHEMLCN